MLQILAHIAYQPRYYSLQMALRYPVLDHALGRRVRCEACEAPPLLQCARARRHRSDGRTVEGSNNNGILDNVSTFRSGITLSS